MKNAYKVLDDPENHEDLSQKSPAKELLLDIFLLGMAAWSQFGFAFFSQETSVESLEDPKKRYLDPYISAESAKSLSNAIAIVFKIFSFADSLFTLGTYLNMKNARKELMRGFRQGWKKYQYKNISHSAFWLNLGLTVYAFVSGSFASWVGAEQLNLRRDSTELIGATMFLGLMISYIMSSAPYIFSPAKVLTDLYKLDSSKKQRIFKNIFLTKKGWLGFLPRTVTNAVNRSWSFYGLANLTAIHVFKINSFTPRIIYSTISALSCGYQTIMSQGVHDYAETFSAKIVENKTGISDNRSQKHIPFAIKIILILFAAASFIIRAISVPSLYTGEIEDPANNYGVKETTIGFLGLILGAYASFQFSRFRYGRCEEGIKALFFDSSYQSIDNNEDDIITKIRLINQTEPNDNIILRTNSTNS